MATVNKDDLDKAHEKINRQIVSLILLLQLPSTPERWPLDIGTDKVFGFDTQLAELGAKLLVPGTGSKVFWLHGMGECATNSVRLEEFTQST